MELIGRDTLSINFLLLTLASSVNFFFGLIKIINSLNIRFYYTYSAKVVDISVFGATWDWIIWVASLLFIFVEVLVLSLHQKSLPRWVNGPCILALIAILFSFLDHKFGSLLGIIFGFLVLELLVYFGFGSAMSRSSGITLMLLGVVGLVLVFELTSLGSWIWNVFDYSFPFIDVWRWRFALVDLHLFNVFYNLTPWLFIALFYSWIWIPLSYRVISRIDATKLVFEGLSFRGDFSFVRLQRKVLIAGLFAIIGLAILVSSYPYFNRTSSSLVGSDSAIYFGWMEDMGERGPWVALQTDRPLSNLLMYVIQYSFGLSSEVIVKVMPVICSVSLSLVVFWFVRSGLHNDVLALVSGFFTVVGFQTTVGIYAYSVSNWLALIWGFLMFGFILKGSENRSWVYVFVASLFGVALLFTHPYTWNVIMAVLVAYFVWLIVKLLLCRNSSSKFEILRVLSVLIVNAVIYGVYSVLPFGKAVTNGGLGFAGRSVVFPNILGLYEGLRSSVEMWVGGLYANPLLVALAVLGMFWVIAFGSRFNRLTLLWVLVPSLALLVVSPENYMFYRIIYLVPIQVLSSIGVFWAFGIIERKYNLENSKLFWVCKVGILLLISLVMLNYSLRSVDSAPLHIVD